MAVGSIRDLAETVSVWLVATVCFFSFDPLVARIDGIGIQTNGVRHLLSMSVTLHNRPFVGRSEALDSKTLAQFSTVCDRAKATSLAKLSISDAARCEDIACE